VNNSKQLQFADLVVRVQRCELCHRMQGRRKILGSSNGNLDAPLIFVAEAPGRLGADRFGIPLYGDQTGRNFEMLISCVGLS
jgi:uracil-DNA glycosylase